MTDLDPALIPARAFTTWLERVLVFLVVVLLGVTGWLVVNALDAKERGYANRAAICRVVVLLGGGLEPGDPCLNESVTEHYDEDAEPTAGVNSEGQRVNRLLLCAIAREQQVSVPECEG